MKKTILLLTVIVLLAGLCACGNGNNEGDPSGTSLTNSSGDVVPDSSSGNQDSGDVVPGSSSGNQDKDDPSSQASSSPADDSDWGSDEFTPSVIESPTQLTFTSRALPERVISPTALSSWRSISFANAMHPCHTAQALPPMIATLSPETVIS